MVSFKLKYIGPYASQGSIIWTSYGDHPDTCLGAMGVYRLDGATGEQFHNFKKAIYVDLSPGKNRKKSLV